MANWERKMEEEWGPAFVHESGHALMAKIQGISCHGIYYEKGDSGGKFCALAPPKGASERTAGDYLFLAAGSAAEILIYGKYDEGAAKADKIDFGSPGSPTFEQALQEALPIMRAKRRHLKRLVSRLRARVRGTDYDLGRLPEMGMDGSDRRYLMLLSEEELRDAVQRP